MEIEAVILSALLAVIGFLLAYFASRLDKTIDKLSASIHELSIRVQFIHRRTDAIDSALSSVMSEPFNSQKIAKGDESWPTHFHDSTKPNGRGKRI